MMHEEENVNPKIKKKIFSYMEKDFFLFTFAQFLLCFGKSSACEMPTSTKKQMLQSTR